MTPATFFAGNPQARRLYTAVRRAIGEIGQPTVKATKSQIAFRRARTFAWVWMPGQYLKGKTAPLVLTLSLPDRDRSRRWKEVVEPAPGRFTHHLELNETGDIDAQVKKWLRKAWQSADS
ncbi:MAG: hypothetical protein HOP13_02350 [Alphaproteobacteria bacterium]|nr:hypothetical protein [Alphaproteobacteria bacterium]